MSNKPLLALPLALAALLTVWPVVSAADPPPAHTVLRACADPNSLPFSNEAEQGFENRIAELIAEELGVALSYTWWAQRRGYVRNTLRAGECDLMLGVPAESERVEATRPYYRSTYVFVHREDLVPALESILDPRLQRLAIGVHLTGDDGANPPPAHALGHLGIVDNVKGYMVYGDYTEDNPQARLIEAVANGDLDIAAVWGPLGGYFAERLPKRLVVNPITDTERFVTQPFEFSIAMGVRKGETAFRDRIQAALDRRAAEIQQVLIEFDVPLVPLE